MINTIQTKEQQLKKGYYQIGSGSTKILILGSCRAVAYITYFNNINSDNKYTVYFIDPMNWNWDMKGDRVDYEAKLKEQETNKDLLDMLSLVDIFIHEHYVNAMMFNVSKFSENNIYKYGLSPKIDIELPNFNDIFILTREIVGFNLDIKKMATQDYNVNGKLSQYTLDRIEGVRKKNLQKFYDICSKTSFPEFAEIFASNYKSERYFWTFNHVAAVYTRTLFKMMCSKFLGIDCGEPTKEDLFANNYTYLCEYDLGYNWDEDIKPLRDIL